jgi:hypothetical protein
MRFFKLKKAFFTAVQDIRKSQKLKGKNANQGAKNDKDLSKKSASVQLSFSNEKAAIYGQKGR